MGIDGFGSGASLPIISAMHGYVSFELAGVFLDVTDLDDRFERLSGFVVDGIEERARTG